MANLRMKHTLGKLAGQIARHKILSLVVVLLIGGGYYAYQKTTTTNGETRYVLAAAEKGVFIASVAGTGQVSVSNQVDLKPKASGTIVRIGVAEGDTVKAGQLIAQLDTQDAAKAVRDAEANLASAKLSLQKLVQPADELSITQAENALASATASKQNAESDLAKIYDSGLNTVSGVFLDLPNVMTGLDNLVNGNQVNNNQTNLDAYYDLVKLYVSNADQFRDAALASYAQARTTYAKVLLDYKNTSRSSDTKTIDTLIKESYDATKVISDAVKNVKNFIDLVNDTLTSVANSRGTKAPALLATHETSLQTYTSTVNSDLSNLFTIKNAIQTDQDTILSATRTIAEKTQSLAKLKAGADPIDVKSQELTVQQRQNALTDAQATLADYFVRAPFDGIVAKLNAKVGDQGSSGTAVATFITAQRIAEVSLNEVDVAKVRAGQKVTLTFDALPDLTLTGTVAQIDTIGTVTQGVVTYTVKIGMDTQEALVRPGMSVAAAIITDSRPDVILVPNGAVKTQGSARYVEVLNIATSSMPATATTQGVASLTPPTRQTVEIGAANDSMTEITSGLSAGTMVVTRTISGTATAAKTTTPSTGLRIPGLGGAGR